MARNNLTHSERVAVGRIGGYAKSKKYNAVDATQPARDGFEQKFLREVDPEQMLPVKERERRARAARAEFFARLARKSAVARRRRRESQ